MLRAASARSIRPPTRLEICEIIAAIKAAKTTAQSAEVTAGLTCMRVGNVALIQPLISAAAVIRGTNARSNTARVEPRHLSTSGRLLVNSKTHSNCLRWTNVFTGVVSLGKERGLEWRKEVCMI